MMQGGDWRKWRRTALAAGLVAAMPAASGVGAAGGVAIGGLVPYVVDGLVPDAVDGLVIRTQAATDPGGRGGGGGGGGGGGNTGSGGSGTGSNDSDDDSSTFGAARPRVPLLFAAATAPTNRNTALIVDRLEEADNICDGLPRVYRIDCLANEFRSLADSIPRRGAYEEAQEALDRVARELDTIARQSRDRAQPRVALNVQRAGSAQATRTPPIVAVRPDRVVQAEAQAEQAIERAQVTLLRSVDDADPRQIHYQRISAAFEGSAVLMRS